MIVAAVPVKDLAYAKQRLVPALEPGRRMELARAMLRDVLRALTGARLDHVWVVTRDEAVEHVADAFGAEVLHEEANRGHTAAVALAQREASRRGADLFVTIPGDVPCVTADDLAVLAATARERKPAAIFAPSRDRRGTNGVALAPPEVMPLTFGEPSFANHLTTARAHGLVPVVVELAGLGLDVDGPDDIRALLADGADTESGRLVASWGSDLRIAIPAAAGP